MEESHVDLVTGQRFRLLRAGHLKTGNASSRVAHHEFLHHFWEIMIRCAALKPDCERFTPARRHVTRSFQRPGMMVQGDASPLRECHACRRERNSALRTLDQ